MPDATYKFINSFVNLSPIANKSENPEVGKDFKLLHNTLKITGITSKIYNMSIVLVDHIKISRKKKLRCITSQKLKPNMPRNSIF